MPAPAVLRRRSAGGVTVVSHGPRVVFCYADDDTAMRNLAVVALTDAGSSGIEVAAVFGLSPEYVSRLRGRARRDGAAGLVARRGRPPRLSEREVSKARRWAAEGVTQTEIAARLAVSRSVISELLARSGPLPVQPTLAPDMAQADVPDVPEADVPETDVPEADVSDVPVTEDLVEPTSATPAGGLARIGAGVYPSRYAGASLLYGYLNAAGTDSIFASLIGAPARHFDDVAILTTATLGFALGIDTVEGAKHLRRAEAGPLVGMRTIPELRTFRPRLAALADSTDPLVLQRRFAAGLLAADPPTSHVYFVDDHFVPYAGARPVAKGYNTKRRLAEPGRADTPIIDERGRAVVFSSGEPSGLTRSLPAALAELRTVLGPDAPVLLGFDRGGAFPATFTVCRDAGIDWVTYRRGPLAAHAVAPRRSWTVRSGKRVMLHLADESVTVNGYGQARQLTLFENGVAVLQVLTSDTVSVGAALVCWLRARWRIENMFKYASEHNGIDAIADYRMDIGPDHRHVANPARKAARQDVTVAEAALACAERVLAQALNDPHTDLEQTNAAIPSLQQAITVASATLDARRTTLKPIPAKLPATELDPGAKHARPHLQRRGLQMVCRLLAFNAEAFLAEHLNAYLTDPNEYRAVMRNLLRLGGTISYTDRHVTVTLDRPDAPRIARALELLIDELNATPGHIPGDRRPLTYQITQS